MQVVVSSSGGSAVSLMQHEQCSYLDICLVVVYWVAIDIAEQCTALTITYIHRLFDVQTLRSASDTRLDQRVVVQ
jgi:hypothetical protein